MKKLLKSAALIAASILLTVNFSSCNKDPQDNTEEANKATKEAIVKQYLNHTVYTMCVLRLNSLQNAYSLDKAVAVAYSVLLIRLMMLP